MILPSYISKTLRAYFTVASEDRRALLNTELFNTDPLSCKKEYLPLLAVEAGVEIDGFAEPIQRQLIANAFKSFAKAGTVGALKDALSAIGDVRVKEDSGFYFDLDLSLANIEITPQLQEQIYSIVDSKKNVRSRLRELILSYIQKQKVAIATGAVGEISATAQAIEGYTATLQGKQIISAGAVGELTAYARMEV